MIKTLIFLKYYATQFWPTFLPPLCPDLIMTIIWLYMAMHSILSTSDLIKIGMVGDV